MGIQYVDRAAEFVLQPRAINAIRVLQASSNRRVYLRMWVLLDATIAEGGVIVYKLPLSNLSTIPSTKSGDCHIYHSKILFGSERPLWQGLLQTHVFDICQC